MLFNSTQFLFIFLPLALIIYHAARVMGSSRMAQWVMIGLSCYFYSSFDVWGIGVLLGSAVVNYGVGAVLQGAANGRRSAVLWGIVGANLALLAGYKYLPFAASVGGWVIEGWSVPLGISFFTFHQIAYQIDIYRGRIESGSVGEYVTFMTFFPHLIAGPIIRYAQFAPQLERIAEIKIAWGAGVFLLSMGLFEKVVLGDTFGVISDRIFDLAAQGSGAVGVEAWKGVLAYTLQIFFDFSGYAVMALGLGVMFGIRLPINFDSPYRATSIVEFWRRWHITLSNFLRDYLYIPLGGNRHGAWRHAAALIATMTLAGVWHGAGWTFLVWGAAHGVMLVIVHLYRKVGAKYVKIPDAVGWIITFLSVSALWVLFRSESFGAAATYYAGMVQWNEIGTVVWGAEMFLESGVREWVWIGMGLGIALLVPAAHRIIGYHEGGEATVKLTAWHGVIAGITLWISLKSMAGEPARSFVYFVF